MSMLLAIDIGNTYTTCGLFNGRRLEKKFNLSTPDYEAKALLAKTGKAAVEAAIICSVVSAKTGLLAEDIQGIWQIEPYIIGKDIPVPIRNLYRNPKQVGQDRLVNAYAGITLYGAPLVVVDFGTAVTFDVISKNREYLGGMILPGLGISLDVLSQRTALLPKVKLKPPKEFIGQDTEASILSGIVYGFSALTDELAVKIRHKIGRSAKVIGTGGNINLIRKYCRRIDIVDRDLTLKGLNLLAKKIIEDSAAPACRQAGIATESSKIFINKNFA